MRVLVKLVERKTLGVEWLEDGNSVCGFFGSDDGFSLMKLRDVDGGLKKFNRHLAGSGHKKSPR